MTLAIFGMQAHSPEGYALYEAAGIPQQMQMALETAEGLLCTRLFPEGPGGLQLQYWRSHDDFARFARQMPHTAWWKCPATFCVTSRPTDGEGRSRERQRRFAEAAALYGS